MQTLLNRFEKIISYILMVCVMCYIAFQTIELVWESIKSYSARIREVGLDYTQEYGKSIFIIFFNILLALEILETVRVFDKDHDVKIRIILLVCIIAISRKVLTLDVKGSNPLAELALAALVVGLAGGYYLVTRSRKHEASQSDMN
jgi:uncharacterized membrane protein (DUF373 family)